MSVLELRGLTMRFGGLTAVNQVDFAVEKGQIFSVIGPNGAGKTTVFNAVTGVYEPTEGEIRFEGHDLRTPFSGRVAAGIAVIGLLTGLLAMTAVHAEELWEAAVTSNYAYLEPFPWGKSVGDGFRFVGARALPSTDPLQPGTVLAFLIGATLGVAGAYVVWIRQRRTPWVIAAGGVCRTFQNIRLFQGMTVIENVVTGMDSRLRTRMWQMLLRTPGFRKEEEAAAGRALELLDFVGLKERAGQLAKSLPYGDQRRLEIARALATQPKLLLLDEPAAGMNPSETVDLTKLIARIRDRGVTVLLIEHHMKVVMGISDRIAVLDYGTKIAEGSPAEVRANPKVIEAYLGKEEVG